MDKEVLDLISLQLQLDCESANCALSKLYHYLTWIHKSKYANNQIPLAFLDIVAEIKGSQRS